MAAAGPWSVTIGPENGIARGAVTAGGRTLWAVGAVDRSTAVFTPIVQASSRAS